MNIKQHDEDTLIKWGRKREELINYIKDRFASEEDAEKFFKLLYQYERLSRERTRIATCIWLLREPS